MDLYLNPFSQVHYGSQLVQEGRGEVKQQRVWVGWRMRGEGTGQQSV